MDLNSDSSFLQKLVFGRDLNVGFAAFQGELTGCVQMIKESSTEVGKVWDGRITPVSKEMSRLLTEFVRDSNWTGGKRIVYFIQLSQS